MAHSRWALSVPSFQGFDRFEIHKRLQSCDVVVNNGKVLILHRAANLLSNEIKEPASYKLLIQITCKTLAPHWRNCNAASAESMPPVASIGNPGKALAIAETALVLEY